MSGGEHAASGGDDGGKAHEADFGSDVVVDGFHAATHGVGFVPESGASGVAEEVLPPLAVRIGASPGEERVHIAPVLADSGMRGEERKDEVLVSEEAFGLIGGGFGDFGAESDEGFEAGEAVDAHAEVDHDQVGVLGEVDGEAVDAGGHDGDSVQGSGYSQEPDVVRGHRSRKARRWPGVAHLVMWYVGR